MYVHNCTARNWLLLSKVRTAVTSLCSSFCETLLPKTLSAFVILHLPGFKLVDPWAETNYGKEISTSHWEWWVERNVFAQAQNMRVLLLISLALNVIALPQVVLLSYFESFGTHHFFIHPFIQIFLI